MTNPFFRILKAGPPPPKVILLPDGPFFTRSIAIASGSSVADVHGQVELALETLSPFPPAQLYHGFYWPLGATRAFVFAAYRRRFPNEQLAGWDGAELVLPAFAAVLSGNTKPETTLVLPSPDGLTALYWEDSEVPAKMVFRPVAADASDADRARALDQLVNAARTSKSIVLNSAPVAVTAANDQDYVFRAGDFAARLPAVQAGSLDVRDKAELSALRAARRRDLALWRGFVGILITLLVLVAAELALVGIAMWHKSRLARVNEQRPVVEKIMMAQTVTTRINDLSTKRLLPFEMIEQVMGPRPETVQFLSARTVGLYGLSVEAQSSSPAAPSAYQAALSALPSVERVEVRVQPSRDTTITFTLIVTFKPEALKPGVVTP